MNAQLMLMYIEPPVCDHSLLLSHNSLCKALISLFSEKEDFLWLLCVLFLLKISGNTVPLFLKVVFSGDTFLA